MTFSTKMALAPALLHTRRRKNKEFEHRCLEGGHDAWLPFRSGGITCLCVVIVRMDANRYVMDGLLSVQTSLGVASIQLISRTSESRRSSSQFSCVTQGI